MYLYQDVLGYIYECDNIYESRVSIKIPIINSISGPNKLKLTV